MKKQPKCKQIVNLLLAALFAGSVVLVGCNTGDGIKEDLEDAGDAVEEGVEEVGDEIDDAIN